MKVVVCDKEKFLDDFEVVLEESGFSPGKYGLVLMKPNVCGLYHPEIRVLERVLEFFHPISEKIVIGETRSMMYVPERQFKRLGILDLLKQFERARAMNLMEDEVVHVSVPYPHAASKLPLPKTALECDLLVNLPKVGKHSNTMLTCALKNLFGLLVEEDKYGVYHKLGVDEVIADLAKILRPELNVVDADKKVIVGTDPLAVDVVSCKFVDLDPLSIKHLRLISQDRNLALEEVLRKLEVIEI